ncbi:hypothetical protein ACJJTC_008374 [Scirpophaga incertulas]
MAKLEEITAVLEDLYELIVKCKTNYKKSPKARITKGFLETRIQSLVDCWKSFKSAHQSMIKITNQEERKTIKYIIEEKYSENLCLENPVGLTRKRSDMMRQSPAVRGALDNGVICGGLLERQLCFKSCQVKRANYRVTITLADLHNTGADMIVVTNVTWRCSAN